MARLAPGVGSSARVTEGIFAVVIASLLGGALIIAREATAHAAADRRLRLLEESVGTAAAGGEHSRALAKLIDRPRRGEMWLTALAVRTVYRNSEYATGVSIWRISSGVGGRLTSPMIISRGLEAPTKSAKLIADPFFSRARK